MELLVDVGPVKSHFSLVGDSVGIDAIQLHGLHRTYHRLGNRFGRMELLAYVGLVESCFGPFRDSVSVDGR